MAIAVAVVALHVQFRRGWEDEVEGMIRRGKGLLVQALRSLLHVVILSLAKNRRWSRGGGTGGPEGIT